MRNRVNTLSVCPLKRNGNMQPEEERQLTMPKTLMKRHGTTKTQITGHIPSDKRKQMPGVCTICEGMSWNGVRIGSIWTRNTIRDPPRIRRVHPLVSTVWSV